MPTQNIGIESFTKLIPPAQIRQEIPISNTAEQTILQGRHDFCDILNDNNNRLAIIIGPCSIHAPKAAIEYAQKLKALSDQLSDKLFIIMRAYFEKPRTTVGWKGLINDPHLNNTFDVEEGTKLARKILIEIAELRLPTATEFLDPITAAYVAELVCWGAIGARTTESQTHRQMASGLSAPIGFKNNSDGNLDVAVNAMQSAKSPHSFLGINDEGECSIVRTKGTPNTHIILRGGNGQSNYDAKTVKLCEEKLTAKGFNPKIMIDCSHENSGKDHTKQKLVIENIIAQKKAGNTSIFGIMMESNLHEGKQSMTENITDLKYGVSITDACIGWEETESILHQLHQSI